MQQKILFVFCIIAFVSYSSSLEVEYHCEQVPTQNCSTSFKRRAFANGKSFEECVTADKCQSLQYAKVVLQRCETDFEGTTCASKACFTSSSFESLVPVYNSCLEPSFTPLQVKYFCGKCENCTTFCSWAESANGTRIASECAPNYFISGTVEGTYQVCPDAMNTGSCCLKDAKVNSSNCIIEGHPLASVQNWLWGAKTALGFVLGVVIMIVGM